MKMPVKSVQTMSKRKWNERVFLISVWIIPLIEFLVLYVYINLNSILLAFKSVSSDEFEYAWAGFQNFKNFINTVFNDPTLDYVFVNSFIIYVVNLFVSTPLSIMLSFFLYKKIYGAEAFKIILFLPQIIASVVWIMLFRYLFDYGVPSLMAKAGADPIVLLDKDATIGFWMMLIYNTWIGLGGGMLIYIGTMSRVPESLIEAGKLDGMSVMQELVYIILPLVYPLLSVGLVTSVPSLFTNQLYIFAFFRETAGPRLYTLGYYLFIQIIGSSTASVAKYPFAAAGGILITLVVAPLTFGMRWLVNKFDPEVSF